MEQEKRPAGDGDGDGQGRPTIDVSAALGEAGHEVADLGFEGLPDTGPVTTRPDEADDDVKAQHALDIPIVEFPSD